MMIHRCMKPQFFFYFFGGGRFLPQGYIELPTLAPGHQHDDADDDDNCVKCNLLTVSQFNFPSHFLSLTFPVTF